MLYDSPLCRDGIVVIKFTKSRKLPRHCFYILLAGTANHNDYDVPYDGVLTRAGTAPEYATPDDGAGPHYEVEQGDGGALRRGASSGAAVDSGGYATGHAPNGLVVSPVPAVVILFRPTSVPGSALVWPAWVCTTP